MKQTAALLLVVAILLSFCACGNAKGTDVQTVAPTTEPPITEQNAPSEELIQEDLEKKLMEQNPHAVLAGMEIVKSLTEESTYEATLTLAAQSKYADWTYEADVSYRKYDQGWMADEVSVSNGSYQIVRMPQREDLIDCAEDYLREVCALDYYGWNLVQDSFDIISDTTTLSPTITVYYETSANRLHGKVSVAREDTWNYYSEMDKWYPESGENPEDYHLADTTSYTISKEVTANFDGQWGNVTISNFSKDGFSAAVGDCETQYFSYVGEGWYISEDGTEADFNLSIVQTEIRIGKFKGLSYDESRYDAVVVIRDSLPPLS